MSSSIDASMGRERGSVLVTDSSDSNSRDSTAGTDTAGEAESTLEHTVEEFIRDARRVYGEYEDDYIDPDAALWMIEGHIDSLEGAFEERNGRD